MRVQACPSCSARYNVERLLSGTNFECRRCGHVVVVGAPPPKVRPFSWLLLVSGLLAAAALLLVANPSFGSEEEAWPWDVVAGDATWTTKVVYVAWGFAAVWALLSSLGIAPRTRSMLTMGLTGALTVVCAAPFGAAVQAGELHVTQTTWLQLLGLVGVGAGLLSVEVPGRIRIAQSLALGGALVLFGTFFFVFESDQSNVAGRMVAAIHAWFSGTRPDDLLRQVLPQWALLGTGLVGLMVGLGVKGRTVVWFGFASLLVFLLLPTVADLVGGFGDEYFFRDLGATAVTYGQPALIGNGLVLWLLGSAAGADLVRARRER